METNHEAIEMAPGVSARERVLSDLQTLTRDAEDLLKATSSDASEKAKEARSRVSSALERAKASCAQMQEKSIATAKAAAKNADTVIRNHPYESIGVAFGVGLLLGVVASRK